MSADVKRIVASIDGARRKWSRRSYFDEEDWDAIIDRWNEGISAGVIYEALVREHNMPYKSERSFFRSLENQRDKRNAKFHK